MSLIIDFFREHLFWIIFILASVLLIYIYTILDSSTKLKIRRFFSGKTLVMMVFALVWFVWHNNTKIIELKESTFTMSVIGLLILVGYNFIGGLKYESQQIQCANGFHGSYSRPPKEIKGFLIYAIDSFNAGGLSWDYAGRILVLRKETVQFCDEGSVSCARPTPCNTKLFDLEPDVKEYIDNNKFLKGKNKQVFYGWFDDLEQIDFDYEYLSKLNKLDSEEADIFAKLKKEFSVENPKVSTLFWAYKNLCKATNKQTEWYDATVETTEKGVEHQKRVKDAYVEKGLRPNEMQTGGEEY